MKKHTALRSRGFSLVELLIVITIIGILAAIAVPKFANASQSARENSLKEDLRLLRTQIGVYHTQHREVSPGYPGGDTTATPTEADVRDQLLKYTDSTGNTSAVRSDVYTWGPYALAVPDNPVNGKSTWKILMPGDAVTADNSTGWLYQPSTGVLKPNITGADSVGRSFSEY